MSTFNFDCSTSLYYFDKENKMVLAQNKSWDRDGDNGKGDAIGRAVMAMEAWGSEVVEVDGKKDFLKNWLMQGIMDCWVLKKRRTWLGRLIKGKYYYQGYRYPTYARGEEEQPVGLSRDHTLNTVLAMLEAGWSKKQIWNFVKKLKFRISDFAVFTIPLWYWMRVVSGRKLAGLIYYPIEYLNVYFTTWWQKKIQKNIGIGPDYEVHQKDFEIIQNKDKPKIISKSTLLLYPVYALKQQAEQNLYITDKWSEKIRKKLLTITPKYNYAIQLMLKAPNGPTQKDIDDYKPMISGRWPGILNKWWNDKDMRIIPEGDPRIEYNQLDVDYIKHLYKIHKINQ